MSKKIITSIPERYINTKKIINIMHRCICSYSPGLLPNKPPPVVGAGAEYYINIWRETIIKTKKCMICVKHNINKLFMG